MVREGTVLPQEIGSTMHSVSGLQATNRFQIEQRKRQGISIGTNQEKFYPVQDLNNKIQALQKNKLPGLTPPSQIESHWEVRFE